jgi:hypothetical protein
MKLFSAMVGLVVTGAALAQAPATYRCVDPNGRSTYTNVPEEMAGRKCTAVSREVSVVTAPPPATKAPGTNAKEVRSPKGPAPAANRANERRRILQEELGDEEKRLSDAKQKLADQQSVRSGDERNYQRVIDRLKPYVEAIEQHEKNIAQLKRELSAGQ